MNSLKVPIDFFFFRSLLRLLLFFFPLEQRKHCYSSPAEARALGPNLNIKTNGKPYHRLQRVTDTHANKIVKKKEVARNAKFVYSTQTHEGFRHSINHVTL